MDNAAINNAFPVRSIRPLAESELYHLNRSTDISSGSSACVTRKVLPVIYSEYHFDDLNFNLLQYTKNMIKKHAGPGVTLNREDSAMC